MEKLNDKIKYISEIYIDKLWNDKELSIKWKLNADVNILAGDNGSGKSTVLQLIAGTCLQKFDKEYLYNSANFLQIIFDKDIECKFFSKQLISDKSLSDSNFTSSLPQDILQTSQNTLGLFLVKRNFYAEYTDIRVFNGNKSQSLNIKINFIDTFDVPLKERESIQKLTGTDIITELDWQLYQLEISYKNYQIDIGKRLYNALESGVKDAKSKVYSQRNLFWELIDGLFSHTKKKIDRDSNDILFRDKNNNPINTYRLSSGEKHMIIMLLTTLIQDNQPAIMIIDEPENSLHTDWQRTLIENIRSLNPNAQLIISTHSPAIVMNGWQDKIFEIDELFTQNKEEKIKS